MKLTKNSLLWVGYIIKLIANYKINSNKFTYIHKKKKWFIDILKGKF